MCVLLTSSGVFLLAFSTWQFSVTRPDCCQAPLNASGGYRGLIEVATPLNVSVGYQGHAEVVNWTSNCSELHKIVPLQSVSLHMSTEVIMVLAILGLVVSVTTLTVQAWRVTLIGSVTHSFHHHTLTFVEELL